MLNLINQKFNKLLVLEFSYYKKPNGSFWKCLCDCGTIKILHGSGVKSGHIKSCGCLHKEAAKINGIKHGLSDSKLYNVWTHIKNRCNNPKIIEYKNYGGRGITMCNDWKDFKAFYDWSMGNGYQNGLEIDRINNDGNYEPSNCRWTTRYCQSRNRRNVFKYLIDNTYLCAKDLFLKYEFTISYKTLCKKLHSGEDITKFIK